MISPRALVRRGIEHVTSRDPERDALRRAVRAAIVVPAAAAFGFTVWGGAQTPLFTFFGSFALLVLVDFPGNRQLRAGAYLGLGVNGAILITLGTLVSPIPPLAVALMFVLGVTVTFAGVLSETFAAGQRATLLTFVLPACTPQGPIDERLLGWATALAICVPAALFLLPPRHHDDLRRHAAAVCTELADRLDGSATRHDVTEAMDALRENFLGTDFRPVGLTAGSRALVRVVDDLQWLADRITGETAANLDVMAGPAIRALRGSAALLNISHVPDRAGARAELDSALEDLRAVARSTYREDVEAILGERDDDVAVAVGRRLLNRRTIGAAVGITGRVIAGAAAADARPVLARVLGRQLPETGAATRVLSETEAVAQLSTGYVATRSVAARNALRTGIGLALAVTATHMIPVQHGFWVVLGALSVLRSSALTTGTKVIRAVIGTALGFVLGALVITVVGIDPDVLWPLLPVVVFGAAFVPEIASFAAAQAAFTMMVLIIFNLIHPSGWQVGLIRIEDVVVGALVGAVVSLLLWPRGATASVAAAIAATRTVGSRYLRAAVRRITRGTSEGIEDRITTLSHEALTVSRTLDDAVRQYLSESGGPSDSRAPVVRAANQVIRLRGAADLIADIPWPPPLSDYPQARTVIDAHADSVCDRLTGAADPAAWNPISDDLVRALRAESTGDEAAVSAALPLVTVAAYLGELELIYPIIQAPQLLPEPR
ncbi:MAG: FUSC family protein [Mycobacterium sp.]